MTAYAVILNIILVSRFRLLFRDRAMTLRDAVILVAIQLPVLILFEISTGWFLMLGYLAAHLSLHYLAERKGLPFNSCRLISLIIHLLVPGFIISGAGAGFNRVPLLVGDFFQYHALSESSGVTVADFRNLLVIFAGLMLAMNEMNTLIRFIFNRLSLKPLKDNQVDQNEFNTGRIIGILERVFVYLFILVGQYTALGFIIAAKGLTRFQDFKDRAFAEYVLIGTLLSTLAAMAAGLLVKAWLYG